VGVARKPFDEKLNTLNPSPETRQSLLIRLRNTNDHVAWQEFVSVYAPLIHAYGMRHGLQDADAADVAQKVLQTVVRSIRTFVYDRSKGSFRGWLFTVTRNHLLKVLEQQKRQPMMVGDTRLQDALARRDDDRKAWDREHERQLFLWAADKTQVDFKDSTWRAFWAVAVEGKLASDVAKELQLSTGAVYIAKSRVTARIRQLIEGLEKYSS
jgi:RNA polymerase sigma-70 factor (ECF subfamily)